MFLIFIIGTAGSGKSLFTSAFSDWLRLKKQEVISVNLDPGVLHLPYVPDVDVRDYVSVESLMEKHALGPNGALIMASDLIAYQIETIRQEIDEFNSDYVLIDTPGQLELFAFRESGRYIANEMSLEPKTIIYLFDAAFSANPLNYVSNMFLAIAIRNRFFFPQLYALSKVDLLPKEKEEEILEWGTRPEALEEAIEHELSGTKRLMSRGVVALITNLGLLFSLIPLSSKEERGFINLHALLMRILTGGEEII